MILSFLGRLDDISVLLGCFVASWGGLVPTFRDSDPAFVIEMFEEFSDIGDGDRYDVPQHR